MALSPAREFVHQQIQFVCLVMMAVGLPLSMFLMSVSSIFLSANWLLWGNPLLRFKKLFQNKVAWIFLLIFAMHLLGSLYTTDMKFLADDIRIKVPLLVYPVVLGSTPPLSRKRFYLLIWLFIAALFASTAVTIAIWQGLTAVKVDDFRDYSPFISHIRLSLLICAAIAWLFLAGISKETKLLCKLGFAALILWFLFVLNLLQSATGMAILMVLAALYILSLALKIKQGWVKWTLIPIMVLSFPSVIAYKAWDFFSSRDQLVVEKLDKYAASGRPYHHRPDLKTRENGHYVFLYIVYDEMERAWYKRSTVDLQTKLKGDFALEGALIRYLTSKNLRKDSVGVWSLTQNDIKAIERGEFTCNYEHSGFGRRLDDVFQEIDNFTLGEVNGNSSTQRIVYVRTAWHIIRENFWFGVGTGDLKLAFDRQYEREHSSLLPEFRLRAHNQYVSIWLGFGLIGFLVFLFALIAPPIISGAWKSKLFVACFTIGLISFLSEDTLESQAGVSVFIFFYGVLLWARNGRND